MKEDNDKPQEKSMNHRILIIGGGPTGLSFPLALDGYNIHPTIFEKQLEATPDRESRALTVMPSRMRYFRWLSINDQLECQAKPPQYHQFCIELNMKRLNSFYQCIFDIALPKVEGILEKACIALGFVQLERRFE